MRFKQRDMVTIEGYTVVGSHLPLDPSPYQSLTNAFGDIAIEGEPGPLQSDLKDFFTLNQLTEKEWQQMMNARLQGNRWVVDNRLMRYLLWSETPLVIYVNPFLTFSTADHRQRSDTGARVEIETLRRHPPRHVIDLIHNAGYVNISYEKQQSLREAIKEMPSKFSYGSVPTIPQNNRRVLLNDITRGPDDQQLLLSDLWKIYKHKEQALLTELTQAL